MLRFGRNFECATLLLGLKNFEGGEERIDESGGGDLRC
jgi:hypothetical protein